MVALACGEMPDPTTLLLALFLIVPGFLFRAGYLRSRARTSPEVDLYALAEAIVVSLVALALLWAWGIRDILIWAEEGTLTASDEHLDTLWWMLVILLAAPFPIGLDLGLLLNRIAGVLERFRRRQEAETQRTFGDRVAAFVESAGLLRNPTVWDEAWLRIRTEKRFWVKVRTTTGEEIIGFFADKSRVGTSPAPRQLYLEAVYSYDEDGNFDTIPKGRGIYIDEAHIATIEFAAYD
jgi:hypothetical protein